MCMYHLFNVVRYLPNTYMCLANVFLFKIAFESGQPLLRDIPPFPNFSWFFCFCAEPYYQKIRIDAGIILGCW